LGRGGGAEFDENGEIMWKKVGGEIKIGRDTEREKEEICEKGQAEEGVRR
jgi:hypothetical protein